MRLPLQKLETTGIGEEDAGIGLSRSDPPCGASMEESGSQSPRSPIFNFCDFCVQFRDWDWDQYCMDLLELLDYFGDGVWVSTRLLCSEIGPVSASAHLISPLKPLLASNASSWILWCTTKYCMPIIMVFFFRCADNFCCIRFSSWDICFKKYLLQKDENPVIEKITSKEK